MNDINEEVFKKRLLLKLSELEALEKENADARSTVHLDQQSVGRLSRMDALLQQAMANETARRRIKEREAINAALIRIENEEFGFCVACGEDINPRRLELSPTTPTCIKCAAG